MKSLSHPNQYNLNVFKYDLTSSVVVFLIAIPLCLGIALASGAPLFSGIISGIIGGIVIGSLSQSSLSVSGPAAGMIAIVIAAIAQLGDFNVFLLAVMFSGILQIVIGSLKAGFIADYIPSNVIQGLLCAIGILIIVKQLPFLLTYTSENDRLLLLFQDLTGNINFQKLAEVATHLNVGAMLIGVTSISLLFYIDKTSSKYIKKIPGPIFVVVMGAVINSIYINFFPTLAQSSIELVNIPVSRDFHEFIANFQSPSWSAWSNPNVYLYGCILAVVASLETLLNFEAIQNLDKMRRFCSRNRELVAQGIGNTLSGLLGGLPITSVIVRSSVNMSAGAKTKMSAILHGVWLLMATVLVPHWVNTIPLAALAAILIHVGYKLTHPKIYRRILKHGMTRFIPFIITVVAIITTDLLTGTIVGLLFSFFYILRDNSRIKLDIINEQYPSGITKRLVLPEHMSFLRKAALIAELESFQPNTRLIIDARSTKYIDRDIQEVLNVFKDTQAPEKGISLNMLGFKNHYALHDHIEFLNVTTYNTQAKLKPDDVIHLLKEGNKRFKQDKPIHRSVHNEIRSTSYMQHPLAIILSCIDSRVPVETVFDMGLGDVFVSRVAGNVMNNDIIASMEFACQYAGAKLILVLGHTYCGAIKAACDNVDSGHLKDLLAKIKPAIEAETTTQHDRTSDNAEFMANVTRLNVEHTVKSIRGKSAILNKLIHEGSISLCGATYDIKTGSVIFTEQTE